MSSILSSIRKRSKLLIGSIGFSLFIFVISNFISKNSFNKNVVGSIDGNEISHSKLNEVILKYQKQNPSVSKTNAAFLAWEEIKNNILVSIESDEKLNLKVSSDEIVKSLYTNFSNDSYFLNEIGEPDSQKIMLYIEDLKTSPNWKKITENLESSIRTDSYINLINMGSFSSSKLERQLLKSYPNKFDYVFKSYKQLGAKYPEISKKVSQKICKRIF